jgi:hypothetical protein
MKLRLYKNVDGTYMIGVSVLVERPRGVSGIVLHLGSHSLRLSRRLSQVIQIRPVPRKLDPADWG